MAIEVKLKKWGNSMAVIVPNTIIEKRKLKENDKILIELIREADLSGVFGMIKKRKMSGQEAKNLARRGWKT